MTAPRGSGEGVQAVDLVVGHADDPVLVELLAEGQPVEADGLVVDPGHEAELAAMDATVPALKPVDAVLLDVPCTGTGTFRRHPDARWRLRHSDLALLVAAQAELLRSAAVVVKPGGLLVYSTCSIETEENDGQVDNFLAEHPGWVLEPPPSGTVPDEVLDRGRLRVLPQRHGTDGSFAARLRKPAS